MYVYVAEEELKLSAQLHITLPESGIKFRIPWLYGLGLKTLDPCKQNCQEIFMK